jgi:hypothetical protein
MAKRPSEPTKTGEPVVGVYAELALQPIPDGMILVFVPALAAVFAYAERQKGGPLTPTEAVRIRDRSPAMLVTAAQAAKLAEERGYDDVDPAAPYESWRRMNGE